MRIQEILDRRDKLMIEWCEPWKGLKADGKECYADVIFRVSVDDCIALQREAWKNVEAAALRSSEAICLEEFIVVHWATVVERKIE
jgi:hypothetical protein